MVTGNPLLLSRNHIKVEGIQFMPDIQSVSPSDYTPGRFENKVLLVTGAAIGSIGGCTAFRAARRFGLRVKGLVCFVWTARQRS